MIRLLLVILFLAFVFLLSVILFPLEWLIGKFNKHAKDISSLRLIQFVFKVILFLSGVKTTVIGIENIPKDEPVLFIGNHRGFFDTVVSYSYMPDLTGYVAKKEMLKVPVIRGWMKNLYCLFLDRENPKEGIKTIMKATDYVKNGISIVIFPEGTRNEGDGVLEFHAGSFRIAERSNCKIIPMVSCNTENVFETHFPLLKKTHTVLEFGTPIDPSVMTKEERRDLHNITREAVLKIYEKNITLV